MKKRARALLLFVILFVGIASMVYAHSGGTDANGGHYNRSTGEYHYHHGYGPHQHPGGVCPYSSSANPSSSSSSTGSISSNAQKNNSDELTKVLNELSNRLSEQYTTDLNSAVYISSTSDYYHTASCSENNYYGSKLVSLEEALAQDYKYCYQCYPPLLDKTADTYAELKVQVDALRAELNAENIAPTSTPAPLPEPTPTPTYTVTTSAAKSTSNEYNDNGFAAIPLITFGGIPLSVFTYYTYKEKKQRKQHQEEERQRQFEERRTALVAQYEGKSISDLANVPRQYLNKDKAPDIKVCISKDGAKYHKPTCRYARGPQISIAYAVGKSPCGVCKPGPCPLWLKEYRRISAEAAQYNIKMLP